MLMISPITEALIDLTISEDLVAGDPTTDAIFSAKDTIKGYLIAKETLVLCGQDVFRYVIEKMSKRSLGHMPTVSVEFLFKDGEIVQKGSKMASFEGSTVVLLKAERIALNFLQHMTGVATHTHALATALGPNVRLCNTRKCLPGMRELQHYAVRCGGGHSHRFNLGAGIMIKDNHIAAAGSIANAVALCRQYASHTLRIEVEVTTLGEVEEALAAGADIIMLDNMDHETVHKACEMIADRALVEISGNITLDKAEQIGKLPVYCASSGTLTHSSHAADISMRFL